MDGATLAPAMLAAVAAAATAGTAPWIDQVRLSPDGEGVLATATSSDGVALVTSDLASGRRSTALQPAPKQLLDECGWASDKRIVCSILLFQERAGPAEPHPRRHLRRLIALDPDGGNRVPLLDSPPSRPPKFGGVVPTFHTPWDDHEHVVVDYLPAQPNFVLMAAAREAREYRTLYRVDLRDGSATRVVGWHGGIVFWRTDYDGRVRLGTGWYEYGSGTPSIAGHRIVEPFLGPTAVAAMPGGGFERLDVARLAARIGPEDTAGPRVLGFSADGSRVYVEARVDGADRTEVWEAEAATLKPLRAIVRDAMRDVAATAIGAAGCGVVGFMHPLPQRPFTWLDAEFGRAIAEAAAKAPFEIVAVGAMSADCRRLVLAATDGYSQRTFHWLDRATGAVRHLGGQRAAAADAAGIARRSDVYRTRDDRRLPIALTLPPAPAPPVVVLLDGDPAPDSSAPLDAWPGFFAAKGYAVAQPVVRGTRGYGTALYVAGLEDRAAKLRNDVNDALSWVGARGFGDAKRVCFLGRGRGGHLALVAAMAAGGATAASGADARCAALYAVMDAKLMGRAHHNPRLGGMHPCCDWLRWAAPERLRYRTRRKQPEEMRRHLFGAETQRSPLLDATHPGFPVLVRSDGASVVHEADSPRFRAHLKALGDFRHIAARGSAAEAVFLADAEALFAKVLGG